MTSSFLDFFSHKGLVHGVRFNKTYMICIYWYITGKFLYITGHNYDVHFTNILFKKIWEIAKIEYIERIQFEGGIFRAVLLTKIEISPDQLISKVLREILRDDYKYFDFCKIKIFQKYVNRLIILYSLPSNILKYLIM